MREPWLTFVLALATLVTAGGAVASYKILERAPRFADVVAVRPVVERVETPHTVCSDGETSAEGVQAHALSASIRAIAPDMQREESCHTVYETQERTVGYEVTYALDGVQHVVTMREHPGTRIRLADVRRPGT